MVLADAPRFSLWDVRCPRAVRRALGARGAVLDLYEGSFEIRTHVTLPAGTSSARLTLPLTLRLEPCDEETCKDALLIHLPTPLPPNR